MKIKLILQITLILISSLASKAQMSSENVPNKIEFEQTKELNGILTKIKETNENGVAFTAYILKLKSPINVIAPNDNYETQNNVKEIEVKFDNVKVPKPDTYLNKEIIVKGDLYNEQTIHDHRPVIMISGEIK
ncbi:MAG: hypothetical protein V4608_12550 [Bacteroidota bacterium]